MYIVVDSVYSGGGCGYGRGWYGVCLYMYMRAIVALCFVAFLSPMTYLSRW